VVVDSENADPEQQIREASALEGNVILIAHYEAVRDRPELFSGFRPDAHIIDEVDNLRRGDETIRAPIIFGIPARLRIGVSSRPVVKRKEDVIELLSWTRRRLSRKSLESFSADHLFEAMDPILVRWKRKTVLPELGDVREETRFVPYTEEQESVIRTRGHPGPRRFDLRTVRS
jgi:hypothetical protein